MSLLRKQSLSGRLPFPFAERVQMRNLAWSENHVAVTVALYGARKLPNTEFWLTAVGIPQTGISTEQSLRCLINTWLRNYWNNVSCRHFDLQRCWLSAPPTLVRPGKHLDILHRTAQLLFPTSLLVQQKVWETSFVIQDIQTSSPPLKARYHQVAEFVWVQIISVCFSEAEGLLSVFIRSTYTGSETWSAVCLVEVRGKDKHCTLPSVSHPYELIKHLSTCWSRATALCFSFMGSVRWH